MWGQGFPAPQFAGRFRVAEQKVLKDKHLKLQLAAGKTGLDSILFNRTELLPAEIDAVFELELNRYQGRTSLQIKLHHWAAVQEV